MRKRFRVTDDDFDFTTPLRLELTLSDFESSDEESSEDEDSSEDESLDIEFLSEEEESLVIPPLENPPKIEEEPLESCVICMEKISEPLIVNGANKLDCSHSSNVHLECLKKCDKKECPLCRAPHSHDLYPSTHINSDPFYTDMGIPETADDQGLYTQGISRLADFITSMRLFARLNGISDIRDSNIHNRIIHNRNVYNNFMPPRRINENTTPQNSQTSQTSRIRSSMVNSSQTQTRNINARSFTRSSSNNNRPFPSRSNNNRPPPRTNNSNNHPPPPRTSNSVSRIR